MGEADPLLGSGKSTADKSFFQSATAIYMLTLYTALACFQCIFWFTFSSDPKHMKPYYGISDGTLDLLLSWGPIIFVPVVPVASWMFMRYNGIRNSIRAGMS